MPPPPRTGRGGATDRAATASTQVLAVGAFGRWCPLASVRVRGEVVEVEASTFPLYLVAAGLAGLAWLGLSYFDAAASVTL